MAEKVEMTAEGKAGLEAELNRLLQKDEPDTIARVSAAAAEGDLRENFAYHDARRELGMIRGRISELRAMLANAEVVQSVAASDGKAKVGSTITVVEEGFNDEEQYMLVSEAEAVSQRTSGKQVIATTSPMGKALLGKKTGDTAIVQTPRGDSIRFKVKKVS